MLVDGGLSSNLPIDVAREMGVDVLIVVDCGFPLLERGKLDSVATVSNQMLAILIRHNTTRAAQDADRSRRGHRSGARGLLVARFHRTRQGHADRRGGRARRQRSGWRRSACRPRNSSASSPRARAAHRSAAHRFPARRARLGAVRGRHRCAVLRPGGQGRRRHGSSATRRRAVWPGQPGDLRLSARCRARPAPGGAPPTYGLALTTRRNSWGPNYLRFGLQLQNDFEGQFLVQRGGARHAGGDHQVRRRVGVGPAGRRDAARGHRGLPAVGYRSRWFVAPHAEFQIRTLPLVDEDERILAEYRVRTTDFGVDFGRELGNYGEMRVGGGRSYRLGARCASATRILPPTRIRSRTFFGEFRYDSVDNVNFPRAGGTFQLGWQAEREGKGTIAERATCWCSTSCMRIPGAATPPYSGPARHAARQGHRRGAVVLLAGRVPQHVGHHSRDAGRVRISPSCAASTTARSARAAGLPQRACVSRRVARAGQCLGSRARTYPSAAPRPMAACSSAWIPVGPVYFATGFDDEGGSAYYLFLAGLFNWGYAPFASKKGQASIGRTLEEKAARPGTSASSDGLTAIQA